MDWKRDLLERLAANTPGGYAVGGEAASEPTALAGLALLAHGKTAEAEAASGWLAAIQDSAGAIGMGPTRPEPHWATALAILLWQRFDSTQSTKVYKASTDRAVAWALNDHGLALEQQPHIGHDTTLIGWSWAAQTHSWVEPTAMFVLALNAVGMQSHKRTREAVRLLIDRQLPSGGCNFGNTIVMGQELLPHIQPTGIAMMALAGETETHPRTELSLEYLERALSADTTTASLCYGVLGLAAHGRRRGEHAAWVRQSYERAGREDVGCYKLALLALAAAEKWSG
jgi:hypothetical protein